MTVAAPWWHRRNNHGGEELVVDCEAFLAGRYVEHLEALGRDAPDWAWLSVLAHGSADDLRRVQRSPAEHESRSANDQWRQACSFLAGEVLDAAAAQGGLDAVQSEVLIPLELEIAALGPEQRRDCGFTVSAVLSVLQRHRSSRQGS